MNLGLKLSLATALSRSGFYTSGGGAFAYDAEITPVADWLQVADETETITDRTYHAFPSLVRLGTRFIGSWMTATNIATGESGGGHASRRGDVVVARSADLTGRNWSVLHRFECTRPDNADPLQIGDVEYRYGGLVVLSPTVLGIAMHKYTVTDTGDITLAAGNKAAWALSTDSGATWTAPVELPSFSVGEPNFVTAAEPVVWQGYVWIPCYSNGNGRHFALRAPLADVIANTATWTPIQIASFGNETGFIRPVLNDDAKLYVAGRKGVGDGGNRIWSITAAQAPSPPSPWTQESASWVVPQYVPNQPQITKTAAGRYLHISRGPDAPTDPAEGGNAHLYSWLTWSDTFLAPFTRDSGVVPITRSRKPSWNDREKPMYGGFVPMGGDLVAALFSMEAEWQNSSDPLAAAYEAGYPLSSGGSWASVFFGFIGAGSGRTPRGPYIAKTTLPDVPPLLDIPGLAVALLASNVVDNSGGDMVWECPISGLRWTAPNADKPGLNLTGSANGGPALTNTAASAKRLIFDGTSGSLPTANYAVYFAVKHATGSGAFQTVVTGRCALNADGNWNLSAPFTVSKGTMDNAPIRENLDATVVNVGPGADTWRVLAFRQADRTLSAGHLTMATQFEQIMNQAAQNRGWNGAVTAILAFDRNTTQREHQAIIAYLNAL